MFFFYLWKYRTVSQKVWLYSSAASHIEWQWLWKWCCGTMWYAKVRVTRRGLDANNTHYSLSLVLNDIIDRGLQKEWKELESSSLPSNSSLLALLAQVKNHNWTIFFLPVQPCLPELTSTLNIMHTLTWRPQKLNKEVFKKWLKWDSRNVYLKLQKSIKCRLNVNRTIVLLFCIAILEYMSIRVSIRNLNTTHRAFM